MYPGRRELANRGLSKTNGIGCSMQHPTRPKNSPTIQELPGKGPPPRSNARRFLVRSLVAYLAIATALSICQIGYVNADFVGYSAIAHRLLKDPRTSITGYWSPLYSWCMAPLIYLGVDDLIAGRVILMVGGVIYLLAIFGVVCRSHGADQRRNRVITIAVMTVAVLQAATWATRMLDPDLLADGLLFCYFYAVLDPMLPQRPFHALLGGALAGVAYLGKAYMLPFTLLHLPATLLTRWWVSRRSGQDVACGLRRWGITWAAFIAGQAIVAVPWIVVLTSHYGSLTLSTAGPANHANMSPTAFDNDPLWNPGLVADFIADPRYGPDWSPLQDTEHFLQQLKVILYNVNSCIIFILPWIVFAGIFVARQRIRGCPTEKAVFSDNFPGLWWCPLTVLLYCGGYCTINLESRYIVPVIAPLLCLGAMFIVSRTAVSTETGKETDSTAMAPICLVDSPCYLARFVAGCESTCDDSHETSAVRQAGTISPHRRAVAFCRQPAQTVRRQPLARRALPFLRRRQRADYFGAPLPNSATSMMEQLQNSRATVYLRWRPQDNPGDIPSMIDAFVPAAPWTLKSIIKNTESTLTVIEVYERAADRP